MSSQANVTADGRITIDNLQETQYVLSRLDPELSGKLKARIKRAAELMADTARMYSLSLHEISDGKGGESALARQAVDVAGDISVKKSRGIGYKIRQGSKTGSIVEFAAQGKTPQGRALVDVLERHFGAPGRFMWQAYDAKREETRVLIQSEVNKTIAEANAKFGKVL